MIGFLCATPYHIMVAITMATGMYADKKSVLVVMDHAANFDEKLIEKIRSLNIFYDVKLYKSNNKTKLNNLKRLFNAVFVPRLVRDLSKTNFEKFFCLALNFIDAAYLIKKFKKRGINCEVAFADDGIGSYVSTTIYKPRKISEIILKFNGNAKYLGEIKRVFVYRPELVVVDFGKELVEIEQTEKSTAELKRAISVLWPLDSDVDAGGKIMYFEQPYGSAEYDYVIEEEISILKEVLTTVPVKACIKMHPRSNAEKMWSDFDIIKSKIPFEAMLLQQTCNPLMYMSNCSTALFSSYLISSFADASNNAVMLNQMPGLSMSDSGTAALNAFVLQVNDKYKNGNIYSPKSKEELMDTVNKIYKENQ